MAAHHPLDSFHSKRPSIVSYARRYKRSPREKAKAATLTRSGDRRIPQLRRLARKWQPKKARLVDSFGTHR